jgi:hypothetical protein
MTHTDYHLEDSIDRQLEDDYRDVSHAGLNASMLKSHWADQNHPDHGAVGIGLRRIGEEAGVG